jgi:hypothetical protein
MSFLLDLQDKLLDYGKSLPEAGKAEELDFEVWGKGYCDKMVSCPFLPLNLSFLTFSDSANTTK